MMNEWFECKVRYEKTLENGLVKKVTEPYLVDALSFTEAERRFIEEIEPFMSGEFQVTDVPNMPSCSKQTMTKLTDGSRPRSTSLPWTRKTVWRRKPHKTCWFRHQTSEMQSRDWIKVWKARWLIMKSPQWLKHRLWTSSTTRPSLTKSRNFPTLKTY